ncbi:uncharacterized protein LOC110707921 isoform X1 [Chenopodium quinoa]|uniref:uncharacterized protein LOC110707921 isoform X1 n=1 Tax=Chenopodium quinoa TaxID=63459 RepID=UPI000B78597E|nr:uncharacterized protein LOC110707921 isoform X1 [Chenopodium quinoa]
MKTNITSNPLERRSGRNTPSKPVPPTMIIPSPSQAPKRKATQPKEKPENTKACRTSAPSKKARQTRNDKFLLGYAIDHSWCTDCKFSEILELLDYQNWIYLLDVCSKFPIYPTLMDEFCSSFVCVDGVCSATVGGVNIEFDAGYLAKLFKTPNVGYRTYVKNKSKNTVDGHNETEIVTFIGGNPKVTTTNHNALTPLHKLLFNIIWRGILPRSQKRSTVTLLDASLIFCLAKKVSINFPALMIAHLDHCIPDLHIPYGSLLTVVFQDLKVPLPQTETYTLKPEHILQEKSLLKLKLKVVNENVCFASDGQRDSEGEHSEGEVEKKEDDREKNTKEIGEKETEKDSDKEVEEDKSVGAVESENEKEEEDDQENEKEEEDDQEELLQELLQEVGGSVKHTPVPSRRRRSIRLATSKPKPLQSELVIVELDDDSTKVSEGRVPPHPFQKELHHQLQFHPLLTTPYPLHLLPSLILLVSDSVLLALVLVPCKSRRNLSFCPLHLHRV